MLKGPWLEGEATRIFSRISARQMKCRASKGPFLSQSDSASRTRPPQMSSEILYLTSSDQGHNRQGVSVAHDDEQTPPARSFVLWAARRGAARELCSLARVTPSEHALVSVFDRPGTKCRLAPVPE